MTALQANCPACGAELIFKNGSSIVVVCEYCNSVVARMGQGAVDRFLKLYTAPGVDHVGSGAPANVDMLPLLVDWVELGRAPAAPQIVEQSLAPPFAVTRARPLCEWPRWPRYRGGDPSAASSFECIR